MIKKKSFSIVVFTQKTQGSLINLDSLKNNRLLVLKRAVSSEVLYRPSRTHVISYAKNKLVNKTEKNVLIFDNIF